MRGSICIQFECVYHCVNYHGEKMREIGGAGGNCGAWVHRVHRVATAAFWRTFSDEGKFCPGWWGWGVHAHPLSLHLPSPLKLECTLELSGQIHWPCFISTNMCTLCVGVCIDSNVKGGGIGLLCGGVILVRHENLIYVRKACLMHFTKLISFCTSGVEGEWYEVNSLRTPPPPPPRWGQIHCGPLEGVSSENRYFSGPEMSMNETHVHKTTSVPVFLYGAWTLCGQIHYKGHWKGWAYCHFRAQKSLDFQGPPLPLALVMDLPASKSLRSAPCKQQVHYYLICWSGAHICNKKPSLQFTQMQFRDLPKQSTTLMQPTRNGCYWTVFFQYQYY